MHWLDPLSMPEYVGTIAAPTKDEGSATAGAPTGDLARPASGLDSRGDDEWRNATVF